MSIASHHGRRVPPRSGGGLRLDRWDLGFFLTVLVILVGVGCQVAPGAAVEIVVAAGAGELVVAFVATGLLVARGPDPHIGAPGPVIDAAGR